MSDSTEKTREPHTGKLIVGVIVLIFIAFIIGFFVGRTTPHSSSPAEISQNHVYTPTISSVQQATEKSSLSEESESEDGTTGKPLEFSGPENIDRSTDTDKKTVYCDWYIKNTTDFSISNITVTFSAMDKEGNILETPTWGTGDSLVKPGGSIKRFTGFDSTAVSVSVESYSYEDADGNI